MERKRVEAIPYLLFFLPFSASLGKGQRKGRRAQRGGGGKERKRKIFLFFRKETRKTERGGTRKKEGRSVHFKSIINSTSGKGGGE